MSIPATEAVTTGMFTTPSTGTSSTKGSQDKDMFLQLLVAQMRYQDPSNPTDSSQFLAQSAQFTALEKMQDVADQTAALLSAQMAFGASGLIGKPISYTAADGSTQQGTVAGVSFGATGPVLDLGGGTTAPIGAVVSVGTVTPSSSSSTDSTNSTGSGTSA